MFNLLLSCYSWSPLQKVMKTCNLICLFFLVSLCALCKGRGCGKHGHHHGHHRALPPPEIVNAGKAIEEMGRQIRGFTEQSTRHFEAMGTAMNDVLKMMSDNTARGINLMEQQVREMKEHTSAQLHAMTENVEAIYSQFLQRVVNVEEAVQQVNTVVKKSHAGLEIGILILVLLLYLITRYLRLHTKNDPISLAGIVILSFVELASLIYAIQLSANILHRHLTGEDIDREKLLHLGVGTAVLQISVICIPFVLGFLFSFIVWCVKIPIIIVRNLLANWSYLIFCIIALSVLAYRSTAIKDHTVVLSVFVVLLGVCMKISHSYLATSRPAIAPKPATTKMSQDKVLPNHHLDYGCGAEKLRKRHVQEPITLQA